jgi:hypothetical protein
MPSPCFYKEVDSGLYPGIVVQSIKSTHPITIKKIHLKITSTWKLQNLQLIKYVSTSKEIIINKKS